MISYDSGKMLAHADRVGNWASSAILVQTLAGMLLGAPCGYGAFMGTRSDNAASTLVMGALCGGLVGFLSGSWYAFLIRIVMHTMLCLAQIEQNTSGVRSDLVQSTRKAMRAPAEPDAGTFLLGAPAAPTPAIDDRGVSRSSETVPR